MFTKKVLVPALIAGGAVGAMATPMPSQAQITFKKTTAPAVRHEAVPEQRRAAGALGRAAVNQTGIVEATTLTEVDGVIRLEGGAVRLVERNERHAPVDLRSDEFVARVPRKRPNAR